MVRGLCSKWKQPLCYEFDAAMTHAKLAGVITRIEQLGLLVVAAVSDMGPGNEAMWKGGWCLRHEDVDPSPSQSSPVSQHAGSTDVWPYSELTLAFSVKCLICMGRECHMSLWWGFIVHTVLSSAAPTFCTIPIEDHTSSKLISALNDFAVLTPKQFSAHAKLRPCYKPCGFDSHPWHCLLFKLVGLGGRLSGGPAYNMCCSKLCTLRLSLLSLSFVRFAFISHHNFKTASCLMFAITHCFLQQLCKLMLRPTSSRHRFLLSDVSIQTILHICANRFLCLEFWPSFDLM